MNNLISTKRISESDLFDYVLEFVGKHAEFLNPYDIGEAWEDSISNVKCELDQIGQREWMLWAANEAKYVLKEKGV